MTKLVDVNLINGIALAFEGDAVYSLYVRRHLIFQGQTKPNQLHRLATRYVSAKAPSVGGMPLAIPKPKIRTLSPTRCQQALKRSWAICT